MKLFMYIHDPTSWGVTSWTWAFGVYNPELFALYWKQAKSSQGNTTQIGQILMARTSYNCIKKWCERHFKWRSDQSLCLPDGTTDAPVLCNGHERRQEIEDKCLKMHLQNLHSGNSSYWLGKLPLVLGMPVMFTQNFDVESGIVNGGTSILKWIHYKKNSNGRRHAVLCIAATTGEPIVIQKGNVICGKFWS